MSLSWCVSHPSRLVLVIAKGEFEQREFTDLLRNIDKAKASAYRKLVDITGLTGRFPAVAIREFARTVRQRERERTVGPIAIVAGSTLAHAHASQFSSQAQGERLIMIFHEQHEARRWLDSFYAFEGTRRLGPGALRH